MSDPNQEQPPSASAPPPEPAPAGAERAPESSAGTPVEASTEAPTAGPDEVTAEGAPEVAEVAGADTAAPGPGAPAVPELSPAATGALLAQHFPALFTPGQAKPIKLRIQTDIQLRVPGVFTKRALSLFLHRHTTSTPYLKALVSSPQRFDLDGRPAGEVAAEHRDAATVEVERRRAIVTAKRQAERQAQRPPRQARPEGAPTGEGGAGGQRPPRPPRPEGPGRPDRPARPERPDRQGQPPRGDRPPRADAPRDGQPQRQRPPQARHEQQRPPRPERPPQQQRAPQAPRPPRDERPPHDAPAVVDPAVASLTPEEQAARRERALLLRAWETTTLTRSNFCVLKRISEADLEAQLAQARQERPAHVGAKPAR